MNGSADIWSIGALLEASAARLRTAGIKTNRLDARVLMAHVLDRDQAWLLAHQEDFLLADLQSAYRELVLRRAAYEPVAYLTGVKEFWSLPFRVTRDTLIPRPDSEIVVETALEVMLRDGCNVIDLGTGTGCLLLSILNERANLKGLGIDFNSAALSVAKENAAILGLSDRVQFRIGRWDDYFAISAGKKFDLIVSNPPYVPESDILGLAPDIRFFEPASALNGGFDGLEAYREIASCLPMLLRSGGYFIGEFGLGQGLVLSDIFQAAGMRIEGFRNDAAGLQRCIIARMRD